MPLLGSSAAQWHHSQHCQTSLGERQDRRPTANTVNSARFRLPSSPPPSPVELLSVRRLWHGDQLNVRFSLPRRLLDAPWCRLCDAAVDSSPATHEHAVVGILRPLNDRFVLDITVHPADPAAKHVASAADADARTPSAASAVLAAADATADIAAPTDAQQIHLPHDERSSRAPATQSVAAAAGRGAFVCHDCGRSFSRRSLLTRHALGHRLPQLQCDRCRRRFHRADRLRRHQNSCHAANTGDGGGGDWTCRVCQRRFTRRDSLALHERSHTNTTCAVASASSGDQPQQPPSPQFQCDACGVRLRAATTLATHKRLHCVSGGSSGGGRRYACEQCGRRFSRHAHLAAHTANVHSARRPHVCGACSKAFATGSQLCRHERTHQRRRVATADCGDVDDARHGPAKNQYEHEQASSVAAFHDCRPSCTTCGKRFQRLASLRAHMRRKCHDGASIDEPVDGRTTQRSQRRRRGSTLEQVVTPDSCANHSPSQREANSAADSATVSTDIEPVLAAQCDTGTCAEAEDVSSAYLLSIIGSL